MTTCRDEAYPACAVHGRMVHRDRAAVDGGHLLHCEWVCVGFDGEWPEGQCAGPVPRESFRRLLAGRTWWPGVVVVRGGQVTGLQPAEGAAEARLLVNQILRAGPIA